MEEVPNAAVVLIGDGPQGDELRRRATALDGRAFLLPFTPPDELATLTPDADLGAIPLLPLTESLRLSLPNKLFEYAAAGLPVLTGAGIEPMRALVERYDAGPVVDPADRAALAGAIRLALFDSVSRARFRDGAARLNSDFSWERERARFLEAYLPLLG
jgi:glycosyltransferase involved in cell wall biosynthesis